MAVDPFFPEPPSRRLHSDILPENHFELIFHELVDGPLLLSRLGSRADQLSYEDPAVRDLQPDEDILSECEDGC